MNEAHVLQISRELMLRTQQVSATAELLADGGTVPFISRYRKEATGGLDEVAITAIRDRLGQLAELDARLAAVDRPVMLDFYADWCVSCKEMEKFTFADATVQARLAGYTLLQADVTANSADDKALLARFKLFGPPGIIFFDAAGKEREGMRVVGFMKAEPFATVLDRAL